MRRRLLAFSVLLFPTIAWGQVRTADGKPAGSDSQAAPPSQAASKSPQSQRSSRKSTATPVASARITGIVPLPKKSSPSNMADEQAKSELQIPQVSEGSVRPIFAGPTLPSKVAAVPPTINPNPESPVQLDSLPAPVTFQLDPRISASRSSSVEQASGEQANGETARASLSFQRAGQPLRYRNEFFLDEGTNSTDAEQLPEEVPFQNEIASASFSGLLVPSHVEEPTSFTTQNRMAEESRPFTRLASVSSSSEEIVEPSQSETARLWLLPGSTSEGLPLLVAIHNSIHSKQVIHSLGSQVVVEETSQLDPYILAQQVTIANSRFDPTLSSSVGGRKVDLPPSSFTPDGIPIATQRDEVDFNAKLAKDWASGATTSVGYEPSVAYLFFPGGNGNGFNPSNQAELVLQGVQPLMRGAGQRVNLATIRIAETRESQSHYSVSSKLQNQLFGIEQAYWQLHANSVRRVAICSAIDLSTKMLDIERRRYEERRVIYADVARVSVNREELMQQKLDAELNIQRLSLQISQLAGMPVDSTKMLIPVDGPEYRQVRYEYNDVISVAMQQNPDLQLRRHDLGVLASQADVFRNQLKPQLDLQSRLTSGGLNERLSPAFSDMSSFEFLDFSVGLVYSRQVGNRSARSRYRQTELETAKTQQLLQAVEQNIAFNISEALNNVELSFARFQSAYRQLQEAQEWVKLAKIRYENPPEELGQEGLLVALVDYQNAIQARVDAIAATADALALYNVNLAGVERQKGTLLERWGVQVACN